MKGFCFVSTLAALRSVQGATIDVNQVDEDKRECQATLVPQWEGKQCDLNPLSLLKDLDQYPKISREDVDRAEQLFGTHARRFVIRDNVLYARDGSPNAIVGVSRLVEQMLRDILKQAKVPDVDFILNCSDYPQNHPKRVKGDGPVVSMCGSTEHRDIIVPTYTLAAVATGRRPGPEHYVARMPWEERENQLVWRGSDSSRIRFHFNKIANDPKYESLTDVGISSMIRAKHDIEKHGPVKGRIAEKDFADYKWIANIDGSVAAYRMPALAALGSAIVKHDSIYLEHWYRDITPWKHYIPMKNDFSDLGEVLQWLQRNDEEARKIGERAQAFALENLSKDSILCFWYVFLHEYAVRMDYKPTVLDRMEEST